MVAHEGLSVYALPLEADRDADGGLLFAVWLGRRWVLRSKEKGGVSRTTGQKGKGALFAVQRVIDGQARGSGISARARFSVDSKPFPAFYPLRCCPVCKSASSLDALNQQPICGVARYQSPRSLTNLHQHPADRHEPVFN